MKQAITNVECPMKMTTIPEMAEAFEDELLTCVGVAAGIGVEPLGLGVVYCQKDKRRTQ